MNANSETFYSIMLYSISAFFSIAVNVVFFLRARKSQLLTAFLNIQYLIILWLLANMLKMAAPNNEVAWLWVVIQYLAVCMFGVFLLDFSYLYRYGRRISLAYRSIMYSISGINYILLFTNPVHLMFYKNFTSLDNVPGPIFYFHTGWSYLLVGLAYIFLLTAIIRNMYDIPRLQVYLFCFGLLLPIFVNIAYVMRWYLLSFDPTPITFNINSLIFGYTAYRYRFLDIKKVSRTMVLDNMHEGVIIIDANDRIILTNPVLRKYIMNYPQIRKLTDVSEFLQNIENPIINVTEHLYHIDVCINQNQERLTRELCIQIEGHSRTFIMKWERLDDGAGDRIGYLVRLIEISEQKELLNSVEEKNEALTKINQQLSENITAAKQLAVAKERSHVSEEIHDILGHTMTVVISLLEIAAGSIEANTALSKEKVIQSMEIIRSGLGDLKRSVRKNTGDLIEANVLNKDLNGLIEDFEQSGIKVDYYYKKSAVKLAPAVYDTVFRICQEGLTNALKHGHAKNVTVGLRYVERHIDLFIIDDGKGCSDVLKGNGIRGMENRVNDLSGYFSCGSPEGDGFNIHVTLPYAGKHKSIV